MPRSIDVLKINWLVLLLTEAGFASPIRFAVCFHRDSATLAAIGGGLLAATHRIVCYEE